MIVGGDGLVDAAVTALDAVGGLAAEDPIGIIPLGTGNDLGQALELPLDASESAAVVLTGTPRRLDLVRDNSGGSGGQRGPRRGGRAGRGRGGALQGPTGDRRPIRWGRPSPV